MRRVIARRSLLAAGLLATPAIVRAQGQNGVALVIGNSKYKWEASLPNVKRDAPDIAKAFQALGLKTELVQDASRDAMFAAVEKFKAAARGTRLAAFYYAGHGAAWDKDTYLVPEDADLNDPRMVRDLLPVSAVSTAVKEAANRLLVFDSCRNNPADGWRQKATVDSSQISASELSAAALNGASTLILFSTAPGRTALDGPAGENSPFATAFLRQLQAPVVDFRSLPEKVRRDLLILTEGRQVLWDQNTYVEPFLPDARQPTNPRKPDIGGATSSPDPARLMELPKAYSFAREKGLLLPPGLLSFRLTDGAVDGHKIGSFQTMVKVPVGVSAAYNGGYSIEPFLFIVLSASDRHTAEVVISSRDWAGRVSSGGNRWWYIGGSLSGPTLELTFERGVRLTYELRWKDEKSGILTSRGVAGGGSSSPLMGAGTYHGYNAPFTRLDN